MRASWKAEDGVALITAMLAVVILGGMAVVFVNRAMTEQRASGASQRHETVLHTAEAAADVQIAALNANDDHITRDKDGVQVQVAGQPADEDAWIRGLEDRMRDSDAWVTGDVGESYAVRPFDTTTGEAMDVIYAAGAIPGFDAPNPRIRTLKLQVAQDHFVPNFAILTDGSLQFGGNASIVHPDCDPANPPTCIADVHVNGGATNPGNASVIHGRLSVAGGPCPSSIDASNGCVSNGVEPQPVPPFTAADFYRDHDGPFNPDPGGQDVEWFDLCPNGTVRLPSPSGPCTGTHHWPPADVQNPSNFRGWEWRGSQNTWRSSTLQAGVFYVHHADASITGSEGTERRTVTILVSTNPANPGRSGSLAIQGNPRLQAAQEDVLFVTDRDLDINGNAQGGTGEACGQSGATFSGFIGVGEQMKVGGTVNLRGAAVVRDASDAHNLVSRNNDGISGTMCLEYDENLAIDLTGIWVVTFWNEL